MSKFEDNMADIFNLPKPVETIDVAPDSVEIANGTVEDDIERARKNLISIIDKGGSILDDALEVARSTESPRAFEVVSQMIKTLSDANKDLLDLQKRARDLRGSSHTTAPGAPKTINNNVFVGSTKELHDMIKDAKKLSGN